MTIKEAWTEAAASHGQARRRSPTWLSFGALWLVALYILVCLIWGTTWIAIKYSVDDLPPLLAAGSRFLVAAPLLIGLCLARRVPLLFPRKLAWFAVFVTLGYFCIPYLLLNVGETHVSSGLTAICFATVSVLIVLLSAPVLGIRPTVGQLAGVVGAFAALAVLVARSADLSGSSAWGAIAVLGAALMHSFAYVMIKRHGAVIHVLTLNTLPMALAGLALTIVGLVTAEPASIHLTHRSIVATVYLGIVASVVCFLAYFTLLQQLSALTVSFVFVIFPVLAQLISVGFEGSSFDAVDLCLTLVIVAAFAVTNVAGRKAVTSQDGTVAVPTSGVSEQTSPTPEDLAAIYAAALEAYPAEACGYVRRSGVKVCANQVDTMRTAGAVDSDRTTTTGYAFGSADLLELAMAVDDDDDPVLFIFHSHPDVGAYFSDEDQRHAIVDGAPAYPVDHLVIDARDNHVAGARRFQFDPSVGRYAPRETYGEPLPEDGLPPDHRGDE